jgi:hypothetical protein
VKCYNGFLKKMQIKRKKQDLKVTRKKTKKEWRGARKSMVKRTKTKTELSPLHTQKTLFCSGQSGVKVKDPHLIGVNLEDRLVGLVNIVLPPLFCS